MLERSICTTKDKNMEQNSLFVEIVWFMRFVWPCLDDSDDIRDLQWRIQCPSNFRPPPLSLHHHHTFALMVICLRANMNWSCCFSCVRACVRACVRVCVCVCVCVCVFRGVAVYTVTCGIVLGWIHLHKNIAAVGTTTRAYVGGPGMKPLQQSKPESVTAECVHCFGWQYRKCGVFWWQRKIINVCSHVLVSDMLSEKWVVVLIKNLQKQAV